MWFTPKPRIEKAFSFNNFSPLSAFQYFALETLLLFPPLPDSEVEFQFPYHLQKAKLLSANNIPPLLSFLASPILKLVIVIRRENNEERKCNFKTKKFLLSSGAEFKFRFTCDKVLNVNIYWQLERVIIDFYTKTGQLKSEPSGSQQTSFRV